MQLIVASEASRKKCEEIYLKTSCSDSA